MKKIIAAFLSLITVFLFVTAVKADKPVDKGYDEYGYNLTANNFNGTGMSWCMGKVGDQTWCEGYLGDYADDKLSMKWNEQWDNCNDAGNNDIENCLGAWTTNHWNGMKGDGTESNWFYKIIWVGSELEESSYWVEGGYSIWGSYEIVTDQGKDPYYGDGHINFAHGIPNGLGN